MKELIKTEGVNRIKRETEGERENTKDEENSKNLKEATD